jgi:hypothetical protein
MKRLLVSLAIMAPCAIATSQVIVMPPISVSGGGACGASCGGSSGIGGGGGGGLGSDDSNSNGEIREVFWWINENTWSDVRCNTATVANQNSPTSHAQPNTRLSAAIAIFRSLPWLVRYAAPQGATFTVVFADGGSEVYEAQSPGSLGGDGVSVVHNTLNRRDGFARSQSCD